MKKEDLLNLAYIALVEYEIQLKKQEDDLKKEMLILEIISKTETLLKEEGTIQ